jgi:asparagine synthase (glutamine-hydrolysing)
VPHYLLAREASREVRVVFDGEGGAPLYGGPRDNPLLLGEWYAFLGDYDRARAYLASYHGFYEHLDALCTQELLARTGGQGPLDTFVRRHLDDDPTPSLLRRLARINSKLKGEQRTLVEIDKMLSANGAQAASPLFDRDLAELSSVIPQRYKRREGIDKYVFKKAVESLLPRPVLHRKKVAMGVPMAHWLRRTSLRGYAFDLLTSRRAVERGYFRPEMVERLLRGDGLPDTFGEDRTGQLAWMLIAIELWHRVFVDGEGRDRP